MGASERMKALWADPEFRAKQAAIVAENGRKSAAKRAGALRAKWDDPSFRAEMSPKIAANARRGGVKRRAVRPALRCETCDEEFTVPAWRMKRATPARYCSRSCMDAGQSRKTGEQAARWAGGVSRHHAGYLLEHAPDHPAASARGYVLQHRLVMERHLGYLLPGDAVVHHRNGIKDDNRIENLELRSNGEHVSSHVRQLTREQVREIRARVASGESKLSVARSLSLTPSVVYNIANRRTYRDW